MKRFAPYIPYIFLTAAIMLPLLLPGYILTHDLVFTPELRLSQSIGNDYLWHLLLFVLNQVLPSQVIEKLILVAIPLTASIGMHHLLTYLASVSADKNPGLSWHWAIYAGSILFAANPFVYSRFMAGQYAVLLGYALLPFFITAFLKYVAEPSWRRITHIAAIALLISIVSIHSIGFIAIIALILGVWGVHDTTQRRNYIGRGLVGIIGFIVLSSYWLVPLLSGNGATADTIQSFDSTHAAAFATHGSNLAAKIYYIFNFQGFWAEGRGLFTLPQEMLVGWGTVRLLIWAGIAWGAWIMLRQLRGLALCFLVLAILALVFAAGIPQPLLTEIGYREPHKFTALVVCSFVIFFAYGTARLMYRMQRRSHTAQAVSASLILILVLLFTPTLYWGFAGQLQPRQYPADWQIVDQQLRDDRQEFQVLALPWHQYMSFGFTERIIANPARVYFGKPVLMSGNPELGPLNANSSSQEKEISRLLADSTKANVATAFAGRDIKYIVVFKERDYRTYDYLLTTPDIERVYNGQTIMLYRNTSFKEDR